MPSKAGFGPEEKSAVDSYLAAKPKHTGNLHERMKWLVHAQDELRVYADKFPDEKLAHLVQEVTWAIIDLTTEVACMKPAKPPFGDRSGLPRLEELRAHGKG